MSHEWVDEGLDPVVLTVRWTCPRCSAIVFRGSRPSRGMFVTASHLIRAVPYSGKSYMRCVDVVAAAVLGS